MPYYKKIKGFVFFILLTLGAMIYIFASRLCFSDTIKNHQEIKQEIKKVKQSAVPTPAYLYVPKFKSCLHTKKVSTYTIWCFPKEKPENCPINSWEKLKKMKLDSCS